MLKSNFIPFGNKSYFPNNTFVMPGIFVSHRGRFGVTVAFQNVPPSAYIQM